VKNAFSEFFSENLSLTLSFLDAKKSQYIPRWPISAACETKNLVHVIFGEMLEGNVGNALKIFSSYIFSPENG
jgi:hypothetical protein